MPAAHDLDPAAMTEQERLDKRRYQAYHAFEMNHASVKRSRLDHFGQGVSDQRNTETRLYDMQRQQFQGRDTRHERGLRS